MTLNDWLHRLERLHYKAIEMGLERVSQVAQRLNLLADLPFIITVGGTNGKGSTVAFLESILLTHGHTVGAYTSPHLIAFNERVRLNGHEVDDASLIGAFEQIESVRGDTSLTYFEFTTLAAMLLFREHKPDVIVLEVGLGGRLDAVNIWDADIAIVASVDLDHQQFLGDTREQIALEKIGIARSGKPLILGETDMPSAALDAVGALGARLYRIDQDFTVEDADHSWRFTGLNGQGERVESDKLPKTRLFQRNGALALQALALTPLPFQLDRLRTGLANATLVGRQQMIQSSPAVMLDVGHNPHAAAHLARRLRGEHFRRVHCVVGMLRDKAVADTLAELLDVVDEWHPVTLGGERGLDGTVIALSLQEAGACVGPASASPRVAYRRLLPCVDPADLILVFGSFFTVADVIQYRQSVTAEE